MLKADSLIARFFEKVVISHPRVVIACLLSLIAVLGYFTKDFKIDASSDTLIQQNDKALRFTRLIYSRYGISDFLVIAYTPKKDLLSAPVLKDIARLRDELKGLKRVASVVTLLDVPLLESPPVQIKDLADKIRTLETPGVDRNLARVELKTSPLFKNLLVSPDLKTTAIQINFKIDKAFRDLIKRRDQLADKQSTKGLTDKESQEYEETLRALQRHNEVSERYRHQDIAKIHLIMAKYRDRADLFLGGVSMIADDLIRFVRNDIRIFGIGVFFFLVLTMGIIFRKIRWVILPMVCCGVSAVAMIGILGLFGWKVTVISSNFISLQLILTLSYTIHLIVRYRELLTQQPQADQRELVGKTVGFMLIPILYSALTTIAGFGSLLSCDILPVKTFGWMMMTGICVSIMLTFLLFPSGLMLLKKTPPPTPKGAGHALSPFMARMTEHHGNLVLFLSAAALILSVIGISRLVVENSFINYFKKTTEIYQGMKVIDQKLGGTTPLDVIIDLDELKTDKSPDNGITPGGAPDEFDEFDEFDEEGSKKYWFTPYKMNKILKVHDYLDGLPETGKVLSLGTMMKVARTLNNGKPLDSFELSLVYNEMPEKYRNLLVKPFVSVENDQVRFFVRVRDSEKTLRRNELLHRIGHDLTTRLGYKKEKVHLAGMLVLYNNMLQSLFRSQILTLGIVVFALMVMFFILFRSLRLAFIAIFPNLLSIGVVLGVMGWFKLPLDMMTITIASISVGIAVDDTIHYIHRFREEIRVDGNYINAMHRCHGSIGYAMYYTSVTVIIGFSILVLSNFIPSILFGLLTGLAMLIALIAALTLLPALIVLIKPFGPEAA